MVLAPSFAPLLAAHDLDELDRSPNVAYGLDDELRVRFLNRAYARFFDENGGVGASADQLGRSVLDAIADPKLRDYYQRMFESVLGKRDHWERSFLCPSPDLDRRMRMRVFPLAANGAEGLLVVTTLEEAAEMVATGDDSDDARYVQANGLIRMCSHCRHVQRIDDGRWAWVPRFVEHMPANVTHGLCPLCLETYFADA